MVAVTKQHKLSGLKQHAFFILQFQRPEVQNGSHLAKVRVWEGLHSLPFPAFRGLPHSLACAPLPASAKAAMVGQVLLIFHLTGPLSAASLS